MAENSSIEWTDHTFNPWIGCTKVSPGCTNCYAARQDGFRKWTPEGWGKGKPRRRTSDGNWMQVLRWNRDAAAAEVRPRVFCASLADWLDDEVPIEWLADLLGLMMVTGNLDWLLLTKRPENFQKRVLAAGMHLAGYRDGQTGSKPVAEPSGCENLIENVLGWSRGDFSLQHLWVGTTVENQDMADKRIPELLKIPAEVRFLSCEPLLGPVDLEEYLDPIDGGYVGRSFIDWVIAGGESGPGARPMHPDWARSLRDQCEAAGVPFLFKQWGEWAPARADAAAKFVGYDDEFLDSPMEEIGKKKAGRLLDGREWNEFPNGKEAP